MCGKHDDYTWRFRIYRTSYSGPTPDAEIDRAIDILHSYIRGTIFSDFDHHEQLRGKKGPTVDDGLDGAPEQQLWKRLRNDILQDCALLDFALPARLSKLHHGCLASLGGKTIRNCCNLYFLILDEEVMYNLLSLPPPEYHSSPMICLTVFDAEFGLPSFYSRNEFEGSEDSDDDEEGRSSNKDD